MGTNRLGGHVALVTGSGKNIGAAVAKLFAAEGAAVIVNGHSSKASVDAVVADIVGSGGKAIGVMADVGKPAEVERMVDEAKAAFGKVDIVVNNVGVRNRENLDEITVETWLETWNSNFHACYFIARLVAPMMREQNWGRLINMSGADGFSGAPNRPANVSAKAAMHGLSKALARELGLFGITCNTIGVGVINTDRDWSQYVAAEIESSIKKSVALGHMGEVEDIAEACLYLASDAGKYVTGHALHVNGGLYMA